MRMSSNPLIDPNNNVTFSSNGTDKINLVFDPNRTNVPATGPATTHIKISALANAANCGENELQCHYTLPISANVTFSQIGYEEPPYVKEGLDLANSTSLATAKTITTAEVPRPSYLTVIVSPYPSLIQQVNEFWTTLGGPIAFVYGIIIVLIPMILNILRKHFKKNRDKRMNPQ